MVRQGPGLGWGDRCCSTSLGSGVRPGGEIALLEVSKEISPLCFDVVHWSHLIRQLFGEPVFCGVVAVQSCYELFFPHLPTITLHGFDQLCLRHLLYVRVLLVTLFYIATPRVVLCSLGFGLGRYNTLVFIKEPRSLVILDCSICLDSGQLLRQSVTSCPHHVA